MAQNGSLGQFEQLILTAILTLGDDAYGVSIHRKIGELSSPRVVTLGAVYVTLERLGEKGFVSSWLSDPTPERGGRAKRYYKIESSGEAALRDAMLAAQRMWDAVPRKRRRAWV